MVIIKLTAVGGLGAAVERDEQNNVDVREDSVGMTTPWRSLSLSINLPAGGSLRLTPLRCGGAAAQRPGSGVN